MRTLRSIVAGLFVTFIGSTCWGAACDGFTDVNATATYCSAVIYLKDHGITLGCTGTTYCPGDFVTRAQMALFLQRMRNVDPSNFVGDRTSAVAGGTSNTARSDTDTLGWAIVGGGVGNTASGTLSTVAGGNENAASGLIAVVSGGSNNIASGYGSIVPGGSGNVASGDHSFAAGLAAIAPNGGCFVWGDVSPDGNTVSCGSDNQFVVRARGGIYMFTAGSDQASYTGATLAPGAGAWTVVSDRNSKERLQPIDAEDVLRKVTQLPIATWNWKSQDQSIRHMGPMAQDFAAAFNIGETPRGINTVDADGVALAAIQGLNAKLEAQVEALTARLVALEAQAFPHSR